MNFRISAMALILMTLLSCSKEQIPSGLILTDEINATDTTYIIPISSIPAPQSKKIFVEEATGVHCANCPAGAVVLSNLKNTYPNKIISASIYSPFLNYFQTPSQYDFNNSDDSSLVLFLNNTDPSKPSATIDRLETGVSTTPYFFDRSLWASTIGSILTKPTPININLTATPTSIADEYLVTSKITFTDTLTADLGVSIYLIEDNVIDYQDSSSITVLNYQHSHILRKIITPVSGSVFLNSIPTKEIGRVFEKQIKFTLPELATVSKPTGIVNKLNLKLICFVHKIGTSKEVIHVAEIDL